jgi:hypothetical protein
MAVLRIRDVYPGFCFFTIRIWNQQKKSGRGKTVRPTFPFFVDTHKFHKIKIISFLNRHRNKIEPIYQCCGSGSTFFGPPGSGSTSQRYGSGSCSGSGSGSFYHHAKIVRKTFIPTIL